MTLDDLMGSIGLRRSGTVGLALSGGGARGFSHIGVFMALEEYGVKPSVISGVSAGSIAAVLYGAGLSPFDIRECFRESQSMQSYREWSIPKDGIFKLTRFGKLLESWLPVRNLEELRIPTVVCATNLEKGTQVAWSKGEIVPRVLASCSIPIVFKPVRINGAHFVDGGVLHNLPAWAIRNYCDILIGSNCSPLDSSYRYKDSVLDIAMRTFAMGMKANVLQDIKLCDMVVMSEQIARNKTFDLKALDRNIVYGYEAAMRALESSTFRRSGVPSPLAALLRQP